MARLLLYQMACAHINIHQRRMNMSGEKRRLNWLDRLMVAITFAEAGDHETAMTFLNEKPVKKKRKRNRARTERRVEDRPILRV